MHIITHEKDIERVLESPAGRLSARLECDVSGQHRLELLSGTVVLHSDEAAAVSGSLVFRGTVPGTRVFWHCAGTKFLGCRICAENCTLYMDRLSIPGDRAVLEGNVVYQRADGPVSGGACAVWDSVDFSRSCAPASLPDTAGSEVSADTRIYVSRGPDTGPGYITAGSLLKALTGSAFTYFSIDGRGPASRRPPHPETGTSYYAEDTGDLYIADSGGWTEPLHLKGAPGAPGKNGTGKDGISPVVTAERRPDGNIVLSITDAAHPHGVQVIIPKGSDAEPPVLRAGTLTMLPWGRKPSMALTRRGAVYELDMELPSAKPADPVPADVPPHTHDVSDIQGLDSLRQPPPPPPSHTLLYQGGSYIGTADPGSGREARIDIQGYGALTDITHVSLTDILTVEPAHVYSIRTAPERLRIFAAPVYAKYGRSLLRLSVDRNTAVLFDPRITVRGSLPDTGKAELLFTFWDGDVEVDITAL